MVILFGVDEYFPRKPLFKKCDKLNIVRFWGTFWIYRGKKRGTIRLVNENLGGVYNKKYDYKQIVYLPNFYHFRSWQRDLNEHDIDYHSMHPVWEHCLTLPE